VPGINPALFIGYPRTEHQDIMVKTPKVMSSFGRTNMDIEKT